MWLPSKDSFLIILILSLPLKTEAIKLREKPTTKTGLYPDNSEEIIVLKIDPIKNFKLIIPEKCKELGICERVPYYPQKVITDVMEELTKKNITFNMDIEPTVFNQSLTEDYETEELCESFKKIYYPQSARDSKERWHLVLNSGAIPQRYIGIQCKTSKARCSDMVFFCNSYSGVCSQKYIQRTMLALNDKFNAVIKMLGYIPSCCSCVARRDEIRQESTTINYYTEP